MKQLACPKCGRGVFRVEIDFNVQDAKFVFTCPCGVPMEMGISSGLDMVCDEATSDILFPDENPDEVVAVKIVEDMLGAELAELKAKFAEYLTPEDGAELPKGFDHAEVLISMTKECLGKAVYFNMLEGEEKEE